MIISLDAAVIRYVNLISVKKPTFWGNAHKSLISIIILRVFFMKLLIAYLFLIRFKTIVNPILKLPRYKNVGI